MLIILSLMKRCGHRLYDDFIEVQPGSLTNLENLLTSYFGGYPVTLKPGDFEHRATPEYTSRKKLINGIVSLWNQVFDDRGRDLQLPWIRRRADDMELCHCPPGAASARGDHRSVVSAFHALGEKASPTGLMQPTLRPGLLPVITKAVCHNSKFETMEVIWKASPGSFARLCQGT